jgi:hypothetical protein
LLHQVHRMKRARCPIVIAGFKTAATCWGLGSLPTR